MLFLHIFRRLMELLEEQDVVETSTTRLSFKLDDEMIKVFEGIYKVGKQKDYGILKALYCNLFCNAFQRMPITKISRLLKTCG